MINRQQLLKELNASFQESVSIIDRGFKAFPWEDREAYCRWLAQTFYMVQHTTRFLCFTASQFGIENQSYHEFCLEHLREETGHEILAKNDLETLDDDLKNLPCAFETQFMIQSQYHLIQKTPFAHFGFFWVLEQLSIQCGPYIIDRVHKAHGKNCTTFLDLHAREDVGHVKEIYERVENFPDKELAIIKMNVEQTGWAYSEMLKSVKSNKLILAA